MGPLVSLSHRAASRAYVEINKGVMCRANETLLAGGDAVNKLSGFAFIFLTNVPLKYRQMKKCLQPFVQLFHLCSGNQPFVMS